MHMAIEAGVLDHPAKEGKRRWPRSKSDAPIRVFAEGANTAFAIEGHCIKTSAGGMCFFAVGNFPTGAQISVEFINPASGKSDRVRGVIRNRAVYLYGVEYEMPGSGASRC